MTICRFKYLKMTTHQILAISLIKGVGPQTLRKYIKYIHENSLNFDLHHSTIEGYFVDLSQIESRIKVPTLTDIKNSIEESGNIYEKTINARINLISYLDQEFPPLLKLLDDYPVLLHYKGEINSLNKKCVAVIGSREISEYATKAGEKLTKIMSEKYDYTIISGLALGSDTVAHNAAVELNKPTAAFLAGGLDKIYPKENNYLADKILDTGGVLISEYEIGKESHKNLFIQRDRLQSGASDGIIVLETGIKGGTRHTVSFARKQNRTIGCLYSHLSANLADSEKFQGNIDIVENEGGFKIFDTESIELFIKLLENKRKELFKNSEKIIQSGIDEKNNSNDTKQLKMF